MRGQIGVIPSVFLLLCCTVAPVLSQEPAKEMEVILKPCPVNDEATNDTNSQAVPETAQSIRGPHAVGMGYEEYNKIYDFGAPSFSRTKPCRQKSKTIPESPVMQTIDPPESADQ